jgi:hypothetical protein
MSQRTNSSSTLRHEPSRTARLPAEVPNSHVISRNHNSYAAMTTRSHTTAPTHTSPFTGSGQTLSGASVPAAPAPQPQPLQNHDVFKNNTVSDDSLVLRGGNIPEQGGGDPPIRPLVPMPIGSVHTEGNIISDSTVVQGPQTTTDLKLILEYKLKRKQIPV